LWCVTPCVNSGDCILEQPSKATGPVSHNWTHYEEVPLFYFPPPPRMKGIQTLKYLLAPFEEKNPKGSFFGSTIEKKF